AERASFACALHAWTVTGRQLRPTGPATDISSTTQAGDGPRRQERRSLDSAWRSGGAAPDRRSPSRAADAPRHPTCLLTATRGHTDGPRSARELTGGSCPCATPD